MLIQPLCTEIHAEDDMLNYMILAEASKKGRGLYPPAREVYDRSTGSTMLSSLFSYVCIGLLFVACCSRPICAEGNFSVDATSYVCNGSAANMICLGDAQSNGGNLSLILKDPDGGHKRAGIAYYSQRIRMRDPSAGTVASFNTSFSFTEVPQFYNKTGDVVNITAGDGITFVISANNLLLGLPGSYLGIFGDNGTNNFKTIVVEFDNYQNLGYPYYDISNNHVSIDFGDIMFVAAKNASDVGILLGDPQTKYAWVEYTAKTQQLEVRVSTNQSRPIHPLLNYHVDLFNEVEEYMWVGFSGSTGGSRSYYQIGQWAFNSSGISSARAPTSSKVGIIVGISAGFFVLLAVVGIFVLFFVGGRKGAWRRYLGLRPSYGESEALDFPGMAELEGYRIRYKQLRVATGGFSDKSKLGHGGFGTVYRGVLPTSGTPVAVKRINRESNQGEKEFMTEVSIISQLRHRNLIQLLGWCNDRGKYLIVYELMPNGSLDKVLFAPSENQAVLSWPQRFNIVTGTAAALDYLHQGWKQQVIHRDIKASNIMLDSEWNAKLGDFGLARLVNHHSTAATTLVAGTYGYIAPEITASGKFTDKADVFSFGAVILEIACGRKSLALQLPPDEMILVDWVWQRLSAGDLLSVADRRLGDYDAEWMEVVLLMGLLCSHPDPLARPAMRHVVEVFAGDVPVPPVPTSKPAAVFTSSGKDFKRAVSTDYKLWSSDSVPRRSSGSSSLSISVS